MRMLLLLSHGQASVERDFSVNKLLEVVNLQEGIYVAQRIICDHIHSVGGLMNVVINKPLLATASETTEIPSGPRPEESTEGRQRPKSSVT